MDKILIKKILWSIFILIIFILIYIILSKTIKKITKLSLNKIDEKKKKTLISVVNNILKYFFAMVVVVIILNIFEINTNAILASLGVVGVVAGLSMQDSLKDLISGFFIIFENQYSVGDIVTISSFKGEVLSLGLKTTRIKSYNGDIKIIQNRNIEEVINHSISTSLAIVNFQVAYEEDLNKVEIVLNNLCARLTKELDYLKGDVTLLGITELGDSGVNYRITVDTDATMQYVVERLILKEVKIELDKNKIVIPYNQMVIHNA
ncbi:MAG: mechanosensitive ion channel family protein [Bacilli bacterium]